MKELGKKSSFAKYVQFSNNIYVYYQINNSTDVRLSWKSVYLIFQVKMGHNFRVRPVAHYIHLIVVSYYMYSKFIVDTFKFLVNGNFSCGGGLWGFKFFTF